MFNFGNFAHAQPFNTTYRCYSAAMMPDDRNHMIDRGGKIILPPSALEWLGRIEQLASPMLFKVTNTDPNKQRVTHCGVLEFIAEEGKCFLPYWMMRNLLLEEGGCLRVESVHLPVATYARFRPQSTDFLHITNQRAVLEHHLRDFACLTKGDIVPIDYNNKIYELEVLEVQPQNAVCIIETDMRVDFAEPVGYVAPEPPKKRVSDDHDPDVVKVPGESVPYQDSSKFKAFTGQGSRLDGRNRGQAAADKNKSTKVVRGIPDYDYKPGNLKFIHITRGKGDPDKPVEEFPGEGRRIRER